MKKHLAILAIAALAVSAPLSCRGPLAGGVGSFVLGAPTASVTLRWGGVDRSVQYLRTTEWTTARATLSNDDAAIAPRTVTAPAILDAGTGRRTAAIGFAGVTPAAGYHLKLELLQDALVVGSHTMNGLMLTAGANDLTLDAPLEAHVQVNPPKTAALGPYVLSYPYSGAIARLTRCNSTAVDAQGRLFFVEESRIRMAIRDANGGLSVATIAGRDNTQALGLVDGPGSEALFQNPAQITIGPDGALYVVDAGNNCIRKVVVDAAGAATVSTFAGTGQAGYVDGPVASARFNKPNGLRFDGQGRLYVTDLNNFRVRRIEPDAAGALGVTTVAGSGIFGLADGPLGTGQLNQPRVVEVASDGRIFVGDGGRVRQLVPDPSGGLTMQTISTSFNTISGMRLGADGALYVADTNLKKVTFDAAGLPTVTAMSAGGVVSADGPTATTTFAAADVCFDLDGSLLVTENRFIRRVAPDANGVLMTTKVLGDYLLSNVPTDGPAGNLPDFQPRDIAVGPDGLIYATSGSQIFVLDPANPLAVPQVYAGTTTLGYADGPAATAQFRRPRGLAFAADGTLYVSDEVNEIIRKVTKDAGGNLVVGTAAGISPAAVDLDAHLDGPAATALFSDPACMTIDRAGNLYVGEIDGARMRKLAPDGAGSFTVSTPLGSQANTAGGTAGTVDGPVTVALVRQVTGVVAEPDGTVYVVDSPSKSLRRLSADGSTLNTVVGSSFGFTDGNGQSFFLTTPSGVASDGQGTLYVSDLTRIEKIVLRPGGRPLVSIFAGGSTGFADGPVTLARFSGASTALAGLAYDPRGYLWVADPGNRMLRKIVL
ncbi:MAG: hypothetical protein JWM80_2205 [Cyanobacteria bacterium RYN_339]|nr:hypothetical protein [Cyanobacteria bacterium RYN_339]